ncbi:soluble lytic murein transglycosylase-like protein [Sphingopyxis sp. OAS728]|uniref:lytic transglycosylase domain-containing protein n=1 Tax=Sphingopyxis sp. OAS728 TaxID=2663823 RepID=UPI00178A76D5|nr:soluble lytic murein transglycosylase-like protein [Sphingopyxis sp. OAS728]
MTRPARSARVRAARIAAALFFLAPLCGAAGNALAAPAPPGAPHPYAAHVAEASLRFGIPENWIWRVMHVESRGNARAVSPVGAMGVMQIMPATWAMLSARHGLGRDPFDVRANILGGAAYLRAMWDRYGDVRLMLAAYNAGPGRADAYAAGRRGLPAETVAYVAAIAPAIGASSFAPLAPAPSAGAPAWRSASLFAGRGGSNQPGSSAAPALQAERAPAAASLPAARPLPSMFVPLSGSDR